MGTREGFSFCRLCLNEGEVLIDIFQESDRPYTVADTIIDLLQFYAREGDGYSKFVCMRCFDKLSEFREFKEQCLEHKDTFEKRFMPQLHFKTEDDPCSIEGGTSLEFDAREDGLHLSKSLIDGVAVKEEIVDDVESQGIGHDSGIHSSEFDAREDGVDLSKPLMDGVTVKEEIVDDIESQGIGHDSGIHSSEQVVQRPEEEFSEGNERFGDLSGRKGEVEKDGTHDSSDGWCPGEVSCVISIEEGREGVAPLGEASRMNNHPRMLHGAENPSTGELFLLTLGNADWKSLSSVSGDSPSMSSNSLAADGTPWRSLTSANSTFNGIWRVQSIVKKLK